MWIVLLLVWGLKGIGVEVGVVLCEGSDWIVGGRVGFVDGRRGRV